MPSSRTPEALMKTIRTLWLFITLLGYLCNCTKPYKICKLNNSEKHLKTTKHNTIQHNRLQSFKHTIFQFMPPSYLCCGSVQRSQMSATEVRIKRCNRKELTYFILSAVIQAEKILTRVSKLQLHGTVCIIF